MRDNGFTIEEDGVDIEEFKVDSDDEGTRLDVYLSKLLKDMSRSYIQKLIKDSMVEVNSKKEKSSYKLVSGDVVQIEIPEPKEIAIEPQDIELDIIYEDSDILIVNKPQGMVVHPAPGNWDKTLVNAIMYHAKDSLSSINGEIRPGIVHRIDKMTSGLLVIAKNDESHRFLAEQFKVHSITREYEMILSGSIDWDEKTVNTSIGRNPKDRLKMAVLKNGGRNATTHFKVLNRYSSYTHVAATLETGRTHQIRVHSSFLKHPILGDDIYGYRDKKFLNLKGQTLHARKLGFIHPSTKKYVEFNSPLPKYFEEVLEKISNFR